MECGKCGSVSDKIRRAGFYKNRNGIIQRYFCPECGKTFSHSNNHGMRIKKDKIHMVIKLLCESSGIRAISRLTGLHQQTVLKILKLSGQLSNLCMNEKIKNVKCEVIQADEIYTMVYCKDWNNISRDRSWGSQYSFLAIDAKSKLIVSSVTGQRTLENAVKFLQMLKSRVSGCFQLNTDAWSGYAGIRGHKSSIKTVFGSEIDHATEEKEFWKKDRFISKSLAKTIRKSRIGNPDLGKASTSYVERINLTLRNFNRRFTRCTLGYSKKLINLRYSMSLFIWNYNFARKHMKNKTTPAIAAGISFDIMTVCELWKIQTNEARPKILEIIVARENEFDIFRVPFDRNKCTAFGLINF
jgi:transposase-like protein/IS1 family transposase